MEATTYQMKTGDRAPDFRGLKGVDGKAYSLDSFRDKKALTIFWHCNHCPYAQAFEARLNQVAKDYTPKGVGFLAINSNDANEYPEDSFPKMVERAKAKGYAFPYVFDESQEVAESYGALCTPHIFVFDAERKLRYQGRADPHKDETRNGNASELRAALDDLLSGRTVRNPETKAFGCSVKWGPKHFERERLKMVR